MPLLELKGDAKDPGWLLAIMNFPNDQAMRESVFACQCMEGGIEGSSDAEHFYVSASTLRLILNSPSRVETKTLLNEATKKGIYAGDILAAIYLMDRFSGSCASFARPSIGKAIYVVKNFGLMNSFGDGEKMYYSEKKIRECWEEFKPVAHFWAAHRINQIYPFLGLAEGFGSREGVSRFLSVAAELFRFGSTFVPKASRPAVPILDYSTAWLIQSSVEPLMLVSARVPDGLIECVASYKAGM